MAENKSIKVPMLLQKFKGWIKKKDVQFLQEEPSDVLKLVDDLIDEFERAQDEWKDAQERGDKDRPLSDFLRWHETHELGRKLWHKLASYALTDIDATQKGTSNLFDFLKAATEFEDLLYGLEKFYRDHTLHSLWVYLIGEYILREHLPAIRECPNWYLF